VATGEPAIAPAHAPSPAASAADVRRPVLERAGTRSLCLGLLGLVLALCAAASLVYGSVGMSWGTAVSALTSFDGSNEHVIVRELRVPRTLIGIAVGAALALAGALMQGVTRNPLAEPGILGVNAGAALAVVLAIHLLGVSSAAGYVPFALVGAALAAVVVYALGATGRAGATPVRLALAGTVLAALLGSVTSAILVIDVDTLDQFRFWTVGSLAGRDMGVFLDVLPVLAAGTLIALACGRSLNALSLGEDVARSLGERVHLTRALAALAVVLLAGGSVAAAGPIAFVGLAVPHVVRTLVGTDWRWVLAYCALGGPLLLLASDIAGRLVAPPGELQVGIVTALVGAPLFVALARRRKLASL
jgi:iron complex transport system permease protein